MGGNQAPNAAPSKIYIFYIALLVEEDKKCLGAGTRALCLSSSK